MRFEAACCTKEIVSREDRNGNEAVEQQGEVIWSLVKDRLEMVMTEWFTLIKWDRDLSQRASTQGKVRKAEGVCRAGFWWERAWGRPVVLWGAGKEEHKVGVEGAGQTEN